MTTTAPLPAPAPIDADEQAVIAEHLRRLALAGGLITTDDKDF